MEVRLALDTTERDLTTRREGPVGEGILDSARVAFSVPVVITHIHPLVACPIFASHPLDLQNFPANWKIGDDYAQVTHVGPPSICTEVKLVGLNDELVEQGRDPRGSLLVRGPVVGRSYGPDDDEYGSIASVDDHEGWLVTGQTAIALKNGTFKMCLPWNGMTYQHN